MRKSKNNIILIIIFIIIIFISLFLIIYIKNKSNYEHEYNSKEISEFLKKYTDEAEKEYKKNNIYYSIEDINKIRKIGETIMYDVIEKNDIITWKFGCGINNYILQLDSKGIFTLNDQELINQKYKLINTGIYNLDFYTKSLEHCSFNIYEKEYPIIFGSIANKNINKTPIFPSSTSSRIIWPNIINNGKMILTKKNLYEAPPREDFPTNFNKIKGNFYDTETAIYTQYLTNLAMWLGKEYEYNPTNYHKEARNALTDELARTIKVEMGYTFEFIDFLKYSCQTGLFPTETYAGFILKIKYEREFVIIIAIRGTNYPCEWYEDAKVVLKKPSWVKETSLVKVHSGFNDMYVNTGFLGGDNEVSVRKNVYLYLNTITEETIPSKIIITGHSLGAGVANLLTADISENFPRYRNICKIFSFAAPYSGNKEFSVLINENTIGIQNYSGLFLVINTDDPIPTLGLAGYVRPEYQLFCFTGGTNIDTNNLFSAHKSRCYIRGMQESASEFDVANMFPSPEEKQRKKYCGFDIGIDYKKKEYINCAVVCK